MDRLFQDIHVLSNQDGGESVACQATEKTRNLLGKLNHSWQKWQKFEIYFKVTGVVLAKCDEDRDSR